MDKDKVPNDIFKKSDKDLIKGIYHNPTSEGLHKLCSNELQRRYSTRLLYTSLLAAIATVATLIVSIINLIK